MRSKGMGWEDTMNTGVSYVSDPLDLTGGRKGKKAAEQQMQAQREALAQKQANIDATRKQLGELTEQARSDVSNYAGRAEGALNRQYGEQQGYYGQAGGALGAGRDATLGELYGGYGAQAARTRGAYDVTGSPDRLGSMMDQRGGLYAGFEQDPGYQFRQQQGEQAINRAASAAGGRHGGATLKELAQFNSGLASQEYDKFAQRRQAEAGMAGQADMNRFAVLSNQAGRQDAMSSQAQQNQMGLAQLAAGAQGDYGRGMAGVYGQQGMAAAAHGGNLASLHQGTGGQLGNLATQMGNSYVGLTGMSNQATDAYAGNVGMVNQQQSNWNRMMLDNGLEFWGGMMGGMGGG